MTIPATLPFEGETLCGYCGQRLVLWAANDWRCPRCVSHAFKVAAADLTTIIDRAGGTGC